MTLHEARTARTCIQYIAHRLSFKKEAPSYTVNNHCFRACPMPQSMPRGRKAGSRGISLSSYAASTIENRGLRQTILGCGVDIPSPCAIPEITCIAYIGTLSVASTSTRPGPWRTDSLFFSLACFIDSERKNKRTGSDSAQCPVTVGVVNAACCLVPYPTDRPSMALNPDPALMAIYLMNYMPNCGILLLLTAI